jgi:photosynthetic reaction center M subunit
MAYFEYQNIFTQVQVQGEPEMGMDMTGENILGGDRTKKAGFSTLAWAGSATRSSGPSTSAGRGS